MTTTDDRLHRAAKIAADWWTARLQRGDKTKFNAAMREGIERELREHGHCRLVNDYDPRGVVLDAVRAAGVECGGFMYSGDGILPRKHSMLVFPDRLASVREGYGNFVDDIEVT